MTAGRARLTCVLAAIVLLAIGAAVVLCHVHRQSAPPPAWQVVADDAGAIRHVVCLVNSARRSTLRNASLVTKIVNALPPRAHVTILSNDRAAFIVARNPHPDRVDFVNLPTKCDFTIWPQDPFLVLSGPQRRQCLLASAEFDRADDRLIAQRLAEHLGFEHRTSELAFQGGNIVVGARHALIGAETIRHNAIRLDISDEEAVRRFQQELGRPVIVLGPLPQPVGHVDMVVTPLDEHHLALADPSVGARLAGQQLDAHPGQVRAFERSCEEQYFGDPRIQVLRDREGKEIRPQKIVGQTANAIKASREVGPHLDKLARQLENFGYHVRRVPFLFRGREMADEEEQRSGREKDSDQGTKERETGYPCLTYNNVLMETLPDRRVVYLPQYGWPAMDAAARAAWERIGYEVVGVEDLATSAISGGSLRCCVKVLKRHVP